ncbi:uncharacterized protein B0P05DRAFT_530497 [Gilbertella persicaria]|uniref:uncharacterized protein n=1 Tax=Gilbertella persicaria TaxID=101096 RepID=UPI00222129A5|nr:uncharacterized protein B0P05DRAFT_530497 [Gilbertella persicaria]KAI8087876.1 hypothetical protein B0P05DRAFT_530497 [Gilbertella persicaria]
MLLFQGSAILCFYSNGLVQGHCIDKNNNTCPYSLAGTRSDHVDPLHHACMEPDDFYSLLIQSHHSQEKINLLVRRPKDNDAGNLFTREHDNNNKYDFLFQTHQFLSGQKALAIQHKYFGSSHDEHVVVCIGPVEWNQQDESNDVIALS